jgi:hypothetical protein
MKIQPRERRRSEEPRQMALDLILSRLASPGSEAGPQDRQEELAPSLSIRLRRRDPLTPRRRVRPSTFEQIRRFEERHRAH